MTDDLDRILSANDEIVPSSGFTRSVMDAVRLEAIAPPPIPFPWLRALPLAAVASAAFALVAINYARFLRAPTAPLVPAVWTARLSELSDVLARFEVQWLAVTLVVTLACVAYTARPRSRWKLRTEPQERPDS